MSRFKRTIGLTLIELLVVLFILALLAGIIYAVMAPAREKGRQMVCVSNLRQIGQLIQIYRQDYGGSEVTEGRYFTMGLPANPEMLMQHFGWKVPPIPEIWQCPDRPAFLGNTWGYTYQVCDDLHFRQGLMIFPCQISDPRFSSPPTTFGQMVKRRGLDYPLVFDTWHNPDPNHIPPTGTRYVIVLRLGGQVTRGVANPGGSTDW